MVSVVAGKAMVCGHGDAWVGQGCVRTVQPEGHLGVWGTGQLRKGGLPVWDPGSVSMLRVHGYAPVAVKASVRATLRRGHLYTEIL